MKKSCSNCKYGQTDDLWTPCCEEESPSCEYPELKLWEPIEEDNKCYDCVNIMQCPQETAKRCKDQNYNFFKQKVVKNKEIKNPFNYQEGGDHYKIEGIMDVAEWSKRRGHCPFQHNIIKYVDRHKKKNGIEDLRKAKQYLEFIAYIEYNENL